MVHFIKLNRKITRFSKFHFASFRHLSLLAFALINLIMLPSQSIAAHYQLQHSRALKHAYDAASNQGRYSGPSSYDVKLGSRTRQI